MSKTSSNKEARHEHSTPPGDEARDRRLQVHEIGGKRLPRPIPLSWLFGAGVVISAAVMVLS